MVKYIVVGLILVVGYLVWQGNNEPQQEPTRLTNEDIDNFFTGVANTGQSKQQNVIKIYTTSWCGYCAKARNLLKQSDVRYSEYDIEKSSDARTQYKKLGGRGVPVVEANGQVIHGYNEQLLKQLIADKRYKL